AFAWAIAMACFSSEIAESITTRYGANVGVVIVSRSTNSLTTYAESNNRARVPWERPCMNLATARARFSWGGTTPAFIAANASFTFDTTECSPYHGVSLASL